MSKPKIYFRADGNTQIGLGHVSRCCALAQMLNDTFECVFVIKGAFEEIKAEILKSCSAVIEIDHSEDILAEAKELAVMVSAGDIVVLDGYDFTTEYQKTVKEKGCLLVSIDDVHTCHFISDVIINHAGGILPGIYSREFYTQLYLGPEYAMLRKPFYPQNNQERKIEAHNHNVLVILGGADPGNETKKILEQCYAGKPGEQYHVVTGSAYAYMDELYKSIEEKKDFDVIIHKNISAEEMAELMKRCPVAITAPSTVAFEYLYIGGFLYLHKIADNQKNIYRFLIENKLAQNFDDFLNDNENKDIENTVRLKYNYVQNLKKIFSTLLLESNLKIAKVSAADTKQVFNWINDPVVRTQSYSSDPIPWETHITWFEKKLNNPDCAMYLFYLNGQPAGQIRFDVENGNATLSYLIDKDQRGKGFGSIILKKGILTLLACNNAIEKITGFVKKDNIPSCKSFRKMNFTEEDTDEYPGSFRYTLSIEHE